MNKINFITKEHIDYFAQNSIFSASKINVILTEMNSNWDNEDYSSLVGNIRTILNIIPTILGYSSGNTVALYSQAPTVSKSEKETILGLDSITRKWADGITHDTSTIGFEQAGIVSPAVNQLLAVVIRLSTDPVVMRKIAESLETTEEQNMFNTIKDFFLSVNEDLFKDIFRNKITNFSYNLTQQEIITLQQISNSPLAKEILSFESNGNFIWNDPQRGPTNGFIFQLTYLD
jgi:hypothetical protein